MTLKTRVQEYWLIFQKRISLLSSQEQKRSFFLGWKSRDATCEVWPLYACKERLGCKSNSQRWVPALSKPKFEIETSYYCPRHKRYKHWTPGFIITLITKGQILKKKNQDISYRYIHIPLIEVLSTGIWSCNFNTRTEHTTTKPYTTKWLISVYDFVFEIFKSLWNFCKIHM